MATVPLMAPNLESCSERTDICLGCETFNAQLVTAGKESYWICSAVGCGTFYPADWPTEGQRAFVDRWHELAGPPAFVMSEGGEGE